MIKSENNGGEAVEKDKGNKNNGLGPSRKRKSPFMDRGEHKCTDYRRVVA